MHLPLAFPARRWPADRPEPASAFLAGDAALQHLPCTSLRPAACQPHMASLSPAACWPQHAPTFSSPSPAAWWTQHGQGPSCHSLQARVVMYYRGSLDVDVKVEAYPISNPTDYQMPVRWVPDKNAAQLEVGCNVIARRIRVSVPLGACSQHTSTARDADLGS